MLDRTDWKIILEYDKDVFQSYHAISKIVGVHHSTVADRIASMKDRNILRPDGFFKDKTRNLVRPTSEVVGAYSPPSLGLERAHVLFKQISSMKDYNRVWNFCDQHPYTHYLTRLFSMGLTIYAQFDIPEGTFDLHTETFEELGHNLVQVGEIEIFRDQFLAKTVPNYERARNFDWDHTSNVVDSFWKNFLDSKDDYKLKLPEKEKAFDNIDAEIIRELTINGKTKITDLADYFGLNKSTLSRRVSKIRDLYVKDGALAFASTAFKVLGINNTQIVTGRFDQSSDLDAENLLKFISQNNVLPFDAFATVDGDKFLIYTRASIGITDEFMEFLFENSDPIGMNQYQFYIRESTTYPFYHGNYDENLGFNTEEDYIKNDSLGIIKNF